MTTDEKKKIHYTRKSTISMDKRSKRSNQIVAVTDSPIPDSAHLLEDLNFPIRSPEATTNPIHHHLLPLLRQSPPLPNHHHRRPHPLEDSRPHPTHHHHHPRRLPRLRGWLPNHHRPHRQHQKLPILAGLLKVDYLVGRILGHR